MVTLLTCGFFGALVGAMALPVVAFAGWHPATLLLIPVLATIALLILRNTFVGLCCCAFSITPLGIVQYEVATVTLGLTEVLILALFAKEFVRRITGLRARPQFVPTLGLTLYLSAAALGVITGLLYGNGTTRVLQDFRQFTEYILLFLLILYAVRTRRDIKRLGALFVLGSTLIGLHGIVQRFTGEGIPGQQILSDLIYHKGIRSGSFYGATPLGALMVLSAGTRRLCDGYREKLQSNHASAQQNSRRKGSKSVSFQRQQDQVRLAR